MTNRKKSSAPCLGNQGHRTKKNNHEAASPTTPILPDSDTLQAVNNGLYIVVVHIKSNESVPRYRRYPFLSLASAQRKVDRARMDGRDAYLLTYQLRSAGCETGGEA